MTPVGSEREVPAIDCVFSDTAAGRAEAIIVHRELFHMHLHLFPRFRGDGFELNAQWKMVDRADLDGIAALLRDIEQANGG